MGWDSYDSFGAFVNQSEVVSEANYMAANLEPFGYKYIIVDYDWSWTQAQQGAFGSGTTGSGYLQQTFSTKNGVTTATPPLEMNSNGELEPDPTRFPGGTVGGVDYTNGMAYLAAYCHSLGLDFGIHIMRGIPQQAVFANDPVAGTNGTVTADEIAEGNGTGAPWLNQMQGLDVGANGQLTPGAQDYYDAIFDQYASWGVDYVKVDDMLSTTYHSADVAGIAEAIAQSGRPMVYSLSPGPAPLNEASQLTQDANMWRMDNDMWDDWSDVSSIFSLAASWEQYSGVNPDTGSGHWPDADMLPLGSFLNPPVGTARSSDLTQDQQRTVMTLWSIIKSPLIMGGDLPSLASDSFTTSLLTNSAILAVDQSSLGNHQVSNANNQVVWEAAVPNSASNYVALFNTGSSSSSVSVSFASLGLSSTTAYDVRNLWTGADLGNWEGTFTQALNSDASGMYEVIVSGPPPAPQWGANASGDWNAGSNWLRGAAPNGVGAEADFFGVITAAHTVYTDTPVTVGTLNFNNANTYQITGAGSLTLQATSGNAQIIVQAGTQEINLPTTIASNTTINVSTGAQLIIANPITIDSGAGIVQTGGGSVVYQSIINVESNASMEFTSSATADTLVLPANAKASLQTGSQSVLSVNELSLNGGTFDLGDNTLVINYPAGQSPIGGIKEALISGYHNGSWTGTGITSSAAMANSTYYGIGYADGSTDRGTPAGPDQIIVKYALLGDANLSGSVDFNDLLTVAQHWGTTGNDWAEGNFVNDPNGLVDFADLLAVAENYRQPLTPAEAAELPPTLASEWSLALSEVPEPGTAVMGAAAIACMTLRRRRA
jgi:alpha-galactosidase